MEHGEAWGIVIVQLLHFALSWWNHRSINVNREKLSAIVKNGNEMPAKRKQRRRNSCKGAQRVFEKMILVAMFVTTW